MTRGVEPADRVSRQRRRSRSPAEPASAERTLPGCVLGTTEPLDEQGSNQRMGDKPCPSVLLPSASCCSPLSSNMLRDRHTHTVTCPFCVSFPVRLMSSHPLCWMFLQKQIKAKITASISRFIILIVTRWSFTCWNTVTKKYAGISSPAMLVASCFQCKNIFELELAIAGSDRQLWGITT